MNAERWLWVGGNFAAICLGLAIGVTYTAAAGMLTFFVCSVLVDIRYEVSK